MMRGHTEEAVRIAREALAIADALGLHARRSDAMNLLGVSLVDGGDKDGIAVIERGLAIALEHNLPEAARAYGNLAEVVSNYLGDLRRAASLRDEGAHVAQRFGLASGMTWFAGERVVSFYWAGRWDDALQLADEMLSEAEAGSPSYMDVQARQARARIALARGSASGASEAAQAVELAREVGDPQVIYPALAFAAREAAWNGRLEDATNWIDELLSLWRSSPKTVLQSHLQSFPDAVEALNVLERGEELTEIGAGARLQTRWIEAVTAAVRGEYERAAEIYEQAGSLPDEAFSRLRAAQALIAGGRRPEGDAQLERALAFYRSVDAQAYLTEAETLLAKTA
jgi:tetratricopeptide (TPR) repeat protein